MGLGAVEEEPSTAKAGGSHAGGVPAGGKAAGGSGRGVTSAGGGEAALAEAVLDLGRHEYWELPPPKRLAIADVLRRHD